LANRPELAGLSVHRYSLRHGRWLCWLGSGSNQVVAVMDVEAPSNVRRVVLPGPVGEYWTVSRDGKLLTGSYQSPSNTLESAIWHLESGRVDPLPPGYAPNVGGSTPPYGASFSDDGRFLGLMSRHPGDFSAMIWDVTQRQPHVPLRGQEEIVVTLGFAPDGHPVGTGFGALHFWDLATGQERLPSLEGTRANLLVLQFSQDGRSVIGLRGDGTLLMWHRETHRQMLRLSSVWVVNQMNILAGNDEILWWIDAPPRTGAAGLGAEPNRQKRVRATRLPTLAEIDAIEKDPTGEH
jgi:WD40 repeat protein